MHGQASNKNYDSLFRNPEGIYMCYAATNQDWSELYRCMHKHARKA